MFPKAKDIVKETKKYENVSQNSTLKNLSKQIANTIRNKESVTCFTGVENQAAVLGRFDEFMKHDRINPFTVEEYYLLRNNLSSKPEEKPNQQSKRGFDSLVSLSGHGDSKKMRESMR